MKRRNAVLTAALALLAALVAFGTVAHFSGEAHVTNVITTGGVSIELIDLLDGKPAENKDGISTAALEGVMPGMDVSKVVSVKNDGAQPVWVRIDLKKTIDLADGVTGVNPNPELLIIQYDTENWTAKDGYYFYNVALQPGEKTTELFQEVTIESVHAQCIPELHSHHRRGGPGGSGEEQPRT